MLPRIKIEISKTGLGQTNQTADGIAGLVLQGVMMPGKIDLHETKTVYSVSDLEAIGITAGGANDYAYTQIKGFYDEAGAGAELYIMLTDQNLPNALDKANPFAKKLLSDAKGRIRIMGAGTDVGATPVLLNGIDENAFNAVSKAYDLAEFYTEKYRPLRIVIGANTFNGAPADLFDFKTASTNRTAICLCADDDTKVASIGKLLGRLASKPVQRKLSRVLDGPVAELQSAYFTNGSLVEDLEDAWDTIHDKGYIFYRNHVGRAGYFYSSDVTCTSGADDFNSIARGRVIDKAYLITYDVLLNHLSDEVTINADGTIGAGVVKSWEGEIENAIILQMKQKQEISNVFVQIDPKQNVLSTNKLEVSVRVQPVGYADFIDVKLGYTISSQS